MKETFQHASEKLSKLEDTVGEKLVQIEDKIGEKLDEFGHSVKEVGSKTYHSAADVGSKIKKATSETAHTLEHEYHDKGLYGVTKEVIVQGVHSLKKVLTALIKYY